MAGLGLAALIVAGRAVGSGLPQLVAWIDGFGVWGPCVFIAVYALAAIALLPGSVLSLAGGALFGVAWGSLYAFLGGTLGALAAFVASRRLGRGWVERRLAGRTRVDALDRAVRHEGFLVAFLLRLSPAVPYNLLNYALGLTAIRLRDYLAGLLGMVPTIVLYAYAGRLVADAMATGTTAAGNGPWHAILVGLGLAATVLASAALGRAGKGQDLSPGILSRTRQSLTRRSP